MATLSRLRDYQQDAVKSINESMAKYQSSGVIMPTGSGKSLVEITVLDDYFKGLEFSDCILVLCHLKDVTFQLYESYLEMGKHPASAFLWHGNKRPGFAAKIIFGTMQGAARQSRFKQLMASGLNRNVKMILIDEAHLFGTTSYHKISHEYFPNAQVLGLSATPFRESQYCFSQFDNVAYAIDIGTLIERKFLCPPKLIEMTFPEGDISVRLATLAKIWQEEEKKRNLVTVVYFQTTDQAKEARNVFGEAGARTAYIDAKSSDSDTKAVIESARANEIDVIVNVNKLSTGIDIPSIGAVMMPFPNKSVVQYLQRIGRALRLYAGKWEAHIYVFGTAPSIKRGDYQRIHDYAMEVKVDPTTPGEKLVDELEFLQLDEIKNKERIMWTQTAIEACELLDSGGLPDLGKLIANKRFPKKYSKVIMDIIKSIPKPNEHSYHQISPMQSKMLCDHYKFKDSHVSFLTRGEAQALLAGLKKYHTRDIFTIPQGPHAGKHMCKVPGLYLKNCRDQIVMSIWRKWRDAGRPKQD